MMPRTPRSRIASSATPESHVSAYVVIPARTPSTRPHRAESRKRSGVITATLARCSRTIHSRKERSSSNPRNTVSSRCVWAFTSPGKSALSPRSRSVPPGASLRGPTYDDAPALLRHRAVANRRRGDRKHPARVVADHLATHRVARVPCTNGSNSACSSAPTSRAIAIGNARSPTCARVWPSEPSESRTPRSWARRTMRSCGR